MLEQKIRQNFNDGIEKADEILYWNKMVKRKAGKSGSESLEDFAKNLLNEVNDWIGILQSYKQMVLKLKEEFDEFGESI